MQIKERNRHIKSRRKNRIHVGKIHNGQKNIFKSDRAKSKKDNKAIIVIKIEKDKHAILKTKIIVIKA
jgi:hypothetical protein